MRRLQSTFKNRKAFTIKPPLKQSLSFYLIRYGIVVFITPYAFFLQSTKMPNSVFLRVFWFRGKEGETCGKLIQEHGTNKFNRSAFYGIFNELRQLDGGYVERKQQNVKHNVCI